MKNKKLIDHPLRVNKVKYPIQVVMRDVASQEGHDGLEHDLLIEASEYIDELESIVYSFEDEDEDEEE